MTDITLELLEKDEAINLEKVFPQVSTIFRPQAIKETLFYTKSWAEDGDSTGEIFFIKLNGNIIGITGYFLKREALDTAGLRWHGIIPSMRKLGYSNKSLELLAERIIKKEPSRKYLSEAVPIDRPEVLKYFKSLGFKKWKDPEKAIDYIDTENIRIELNKLQ